jgi:hypothetical protein
VSPFYGNTFHNKRLIAHGLPDLVRPWLLENSHITGKNGDFGIVLEYDTDLKQLTRSTRGALLPERA